MAIDKVAVTINIVGKNMQVSCPVDQRDNLKAAATEVDKLMRMSKANSGVMEPERLAIISAINFADDYLKLKASIGTTPAQNDSGTEAAAVNTIAPEVLERAEAALEKYRETRNATL